MLSSFIKFYVNSINKRPVLTNSLTTGFLFATGDFLAQKLFPDIESSNASKARSMPNRKTYNYHRTLNSIIYGSIIFSPIGLRWYKLLNKLNLNRRVIKFPGMKKFETNYNINVNNTIARVCIDQLVFAPISIPFYFVCLSILDFPSNDKLINFTEIKDKLDKLWIKTLQTNWKIWPLFQFVNFSIIPLQYRLVTVNFMAIFWNTYLSYTNSSSKKSEKPVYYPPLNE